MGGCNGYTPSRSQQQHVARTRGTRKPYQEQLPLQGSVHACSRPGLPLIFTVNVPRSPGSFSATWPRLVGTWLGNSGVEMVVWVGLAEP